jgi:hypothetical protein
MGNTLRSCTSKLNLQPEKELKINFQAFPYSENKFSLAGKYIFTVGKFLFHQ